MSKSTKSVPQKGKKAILMEEIAINIDTLDPVTTFLGLETCMSSDTTQENQRIEVVYDLVDKNIVVPDPNDNPQITLKKSSEFMSTQKLDFQSKLMEKYGQIFPLIVMESESELTLQYRYLGDLPTYYSVTDYLNKVKIEKVWIAKISKHANRDEVDKVWAEINMPDKYQSSLHRLVMNRFYLEEKKLSKLEIKKLSSVETPNGKEAKKIDRDLKICSSDVLYRLVTGIQKVKEYNPSEMNAKMTYTQGLDVAQILGEDISLQKKFEDIMETWIGEAREKEIDSDISKPITERSWYISNKPSEIARGIVGQKVLPSKFHFSKSSKWEIRAIDENSRQLLIPAMSIDLKAKSDQDIQKLLEVRCKSESIFYTTKAYLKTISPLQHGGAIRGRAAADDSSFEIRSNVSEFYNNKYIKEIFHSKMLKYCNQFGFLESLKMNIKSFGFSSPDEYISYEKIREAFFIWKALNADKFLVEDCLPNSPVNVLSNSNVLLVLADMIDKHIPIESTERDFNSFFLLIFELVFNFLQKEYEAELKRRNLEY